MLVLLVLLATACVCGCSDDVVLSVTPERIEALGDELWLASTDGIYRATRGRRA